MSPPVGGRAFDLRLVSVALVLLAVVSGIAVWSITRLVGPMPNAAPPDSSTYGPDASAATAPSNLQAPAAEARAPFNIRAESQPSATNGPRVAGLLGSVARTDEPGADRAVGTRGVIPDIEIGADARATSRVEAPPAAVAEVEAEASPEAAATDALIYSSRDVDVVAPFVLWPAGLGILPSASRRADQSMIDVVVNSDGSVALVTAQRRPRSLDEALIMTMSLSAAKAWRFKPALKDGLPVRYRQVITVSLR